ncbi:hypothetical protein K469DRAFT_681983 [Zopfia rhizophila CBS 207.26]|uniref:Uncharacterized protein n=1 Tax=Zopfia rhizophila CBS 207.26 TaxID=1314779 RepID=A0A6A6EWQ9_9PEZI|nr:hypothetical protein K469DRAFT_681983 [Zopfia rhizophila CBS 207.26]
MPAGGPDRQQPCGGRGNTNTNDLQRDPIWADGRDWRRGPKQTGRHLARGRCRQPAALDLQRVVQYDVGKTTQSGFERTGSLNSPPQILLSAVSIMHANKLQGRSKLSEYLSKLRYLPEFRCEAAGPDVLFEAMYNHVGGQTCDQCDAYKTLR